MSVLPRIDEIAEKIYSLKPDWSWQEEIDVNNLSPGKIKDCVNQGLYNKAAIVLVDKSKFTFVKSLGVKKETAFTLNAVNLITTIEGGLSEQKSESKIQEEIQARGDLNSRLLSKIRRENVH